MIKYFAWIFMLISIGFSSVNAQDESIELELSSDYNIPSGTYLESIISSDADNIYLLRKNYPGNILSGGGFGPKLKSVIIESYDRDNLKLLNAIDIDLKYQKKLRTFHEIFKVKDNLFLITSFFNSAQRKNFLFAQKLNKKFVPSEDLMLIGEIDSRNEAQIGDFLIKHSIDTSKIVIFHDLPNKRNENERAKISVFDSNFEKIWDKTINLPFESKLYERIKFDVDKKGNAYVLGKHYFAKKRDSRKQKPNYEFVLEAYSQNGEQKDKYQLNDKERFISDLTFEVNRKEQVICTGFYSSSRPSRGNTSNSLASGPALLGIVFFRIDNQDKRIEKKQFTPFDIDFIALNESDRERRALERKANDDNEKNDPGLYSYDFRDVILRSDGGAVMIAEQYYSYDQNNFNDPFNNGFNNRSFNNRIRIDSIHVFSDIMVVNINPDGSIQWANSVPKYQSSLNYNTYRYLSFANTNYKDKIQLVFNERVDYFESDSSLGEKIMTSRVNKYGLAMATIDKRGELEIQLIAANKDMGIQTMPRLTKQIGKKELIFYGQLGNKFRIGKILLE